VFERGFNRFVFVQRRYQHLIFLGYEDNGKCRSSKRSCDGVCSDSSPRAEYTESDEIIDTTRSDNVHGVDDVHRVCGICGVASGSSSGRINCRAICRGRTAATPDSHCVYHAGDSPRCEPSVFVCDATDVSHVRPGTRPGTRTCARACVVV